MDFTTHDATALADLVRKREVTPLELVDAAIGRIEALNGKLNAVVTPLFEQARTAAEGKIADAPFAGVPFLLKDLLAAQAGVRQTFGSSLLKSHVPTHDDELTTRLLRAGLIVVGRTNVPEFGILPTTESRFLGPCHNPWNLGHSTGGSSGGSAAAVAARIVPMAHANDGGGSIRIPASCNGLFGLKPTRARNPLGPNVGDIMSGLVVEHAVTRSVRDSAALLDATHGLDPGAPYDAPAPRRPYREEVSLGPGKLRIAMSTSSPTGGPAHAECIAAVEATAKLLTELGHTVTEAAPHVDPGELFPAFMAVWTAGVTANVDGFSALLGRAATQEDLEPITWMLSEQGRAVTGGQYLLAIGALQRVTRQIARWMGDYDLLLTPTLAEPPPPLGSYDGTPDNPMEGFMVAARVAPFTPIANVTGQPAMSVPLHWSSAGLPIGVQFVGHYGDEGTLFRLAAQLEQARPWKDRRPAGF